MIYGNEDSVSYTYDELDRLTGKVYTDGRYVTYTYNAEGQLAKLTYGDGNSEAASDLFEYDNLGRLVRSSEANGSGNIMQRTEHIYDEHNRLKRQSWTVNNQSYSEAYTYNDGEDQTGNLATMTTGTGNVLNYSYDPLKRLQKVTVKSGTTSLFSTAYAYRSIDSSRTTQQVEFRNVRIGDSGTILEGKKYVYDALGNITEIRQSTSPYNVLVAYEYDAQNQLTKETYYDGNGTGAGHITDYYHYTYDAAGNLLTAGKNGEILQTYTYNDTDWNDLLTAINGQPIVYDACGNPTTYVTGEYSYIFSWTEGNRLATIADPEFEEIVGYRYSYDANGIRTSKLGTLDRHQYQTLNGKVILERITLPKRQRRILAFFYDESGRPFALNYSTNGTSFTTYYYILNLQGDVVKLVEADGTPVAEYSYDAWGKVLSATGTMAEINPLRYRGYYYDAETGFYYLQSRYYDPVNRRFINADSYSSTGQSFIGTNMFVYCGNNPVTRADTTGLLWEEIVDFLAGIFGAGATVEEQESTPPVESVISPFNLLVTVRSGILFTTQLAEYGDSTKPISVYAKGRADSEALSSAGIKINIFHTTINFSLGLNNIGASVQHSDGDKQTSYAIKADLSRLEVGVEAAHTRKWSDRTSSTHYNFYGITFAGIATAVAAITFPNVAAAWAAR